MGTVGHRQVHAGLRGPGQHPGPAVTEGFQVELEGQLAIPELLSPGCASLQREDRETAWDSGGCTWLPAGLQLPLLHSGGLRTGV